MTGIQTFFETTYPIRYDWLPNAWQQFVNVVIYWAFLLLVARFLSSLRKWHITKIEPLKWIKALGKIIAWIRMSKKMQLAWWLYKKCHKALHSHNQSLRKEHGKYSLRISYDPSSLWDEVYNSHVDVYFKRRSKSISEQYRLWSHSHITEHGIKSHFPWWLTEQVE